MVFQFFVVSFLEKFSFSFEVVSWKINLSLSRPSKKIISQGHHIVAKVLDRQDTQVVHKLNIIGIHIMGDPLFS